MTTAQQGFIVVPANAVTDATTAYGSTNGARQLAKDNEATVRISSSYYDVFHGIKNERRYIMVTNVERAIFIPAS